jgi:DhnA family fructose-bisphosphate aldolase class Ia
MDKLLIKGDLGNKSLIMAYDHGIEHRADFTIPESSNPDYVLSIAEKADLPLAMQKGTY